MKQKQLTLDIIFRKKMVLLSTVTAESAVRCENSNVVADNTEDLCGSMVTLIERQCNRAAYNIHFVMYKYYYRLD
jgi:hypothetical protein